MRRGLALITVSLISILGIAQASASSLNVPTISISPAVVNQTIIPGETSAQQVSITNESNFNYNYQVTAVPYGVSSENYLPVFKALPGFINTSSWLHLTNAKGLLPANTSLNLPYSVDVPSGLKPGGYYGAVLIKISPLLSSLKGNVISINQQLAEILYMEVPGPLSNGGKVISWQFSSFQKPPVSGALTFKNTGGIYYFITAKVNYRNIFGSVKFSGTYQHIVLPGTTRQISINWPGSPSYGLYKVNGQVSWDGINVNLPTRYVLVMSNTIRVIVGIVFILGLIIISRLVFKRYYRKQSK